MKHILPVYLQFVLETHTHSDIVRPYEQLETNRIERIYEPTNSLLIKQEKVQRYKHAQVERSFIFFLPV